MGEDGGDCEREAGGNGLENDDHFQVRTRLARQLDRQPECSGALPVGINRSNDSIKHLYRPQMPLLSVATLSSRTMQPTSAIGYTSRRDWAPGSDSSAPFDKPSGHSRPGRIHNYSPGRGRDVLKLKREDSRMSHQPGMFFHRVAGKDMWVTDERRGATSA